MVLNTQQHDRDAVGLTYVYPVLSRRAGGVSVGINLNVNNACNWACIYCQVPNLQRGGPAPIDLAKLETELADFLADIVHGDFLQREVPEAAVRRLVDIAFSGNGEPTMAPEFPAAVAIVARVLAAHGLTGRIPVRVITNGSQLGKRSVQAALRALAPLGGEVWFKVDRVGRAETRVVNGIGLDPEIVRRHARAACACAPTWLQTCWFGLDGVPPSAPAAADYLQLVADLAGEIAGVHLYGLARPSCQPGAARLQRLDGAALTALAERIRGLGVPVQVSP